MSILIKSMEMPKSCWLCPLSVLYEKPREMLFCRITKEEVLRNKVDGNCPLIEVTPESDDSLSCGICDDSKQKSTNEERKYGKWEWARGGGTPRAKCSACEKESLFPFPAQFTNSFNFCPNCGADMRGEP